MTDGGVQRPNIIIRIGEEMSQFCSLHVIGIGSKVKKDFCMELASKARGQATFVDEKEENMKAMMV